MREFRVGDDAEPTLVPWIVSTRANSVRNNGPELIEPTDAGPSHD
jgi:hypothetical protein